MYAIILYYYYDSVYLKLNSFENISKYLFVHLEIHTCCVYICDQVKHNTRSSAMVIKRNILISRYIIKMTIELQAGNCSTNHDVRYMIYIQVYYPLSLSLKINYF